MHIENKAERQYRSHRSFVWGLLLILIGSLFLLDRSDILDVGKIWQYWPLIIAFFGVTEILSAVHSRHVVKGCFNIIVGVWLFVSLEHIWGWTFANRWPFLLIGVGACTVLGAWLDHTSPRHHDETDKGNTL